MKVFPSLLALIAAVSLGFALIMPGFAQSRNGLAIEAVVVRNANLRFGPGTDHAVIGAAWQGQWVTITDKVGDWYQLNTGEWIATFLVAPTTASRVVAFDIRSRPVILATPAGTTIEYIANLRSGPGTTYPIVAQAQPLQRLDLIGRNPTGEWLALRNGMWIASFLVLGAPTDLPVTDITWVTPTPMPSPEPSATPTQVFLVPPVTPAAQRGVNNVVIEAVFGLGVVSRTESDEYAVIANLGTTPVNIGGWRLNVGTKGQDYIFSNFVLEGNQRIRVYTDEIHPETGGFSFGSSNPLWQNEGDCGYLFDAVGTQVSSFCY